ncbi:hypothetical protein [Streptomyces sp. NBC_00151]|uniref:hypothetical protein n=1 Tax=Streptomyces sp. NBC_00151 TaxID=2975669 RepID=UPI002DDC5F2B|nr:hypothetical protein [Streptomyces sp. NBC_00151]WRZ37004.1 hypothetical protein OG915_02340 [Streptomyces sp. NBC_00151]
MAITADRGRLLWLLSLAAVREGKSNGTVYALGATLRNVPRPDLTEQEYLREVERLANEVVAAAIGEEWLSYAPDPSDATPLQRAVNALARAMRHYHFVGDGCAEEDGRPSIKLAGVVLIRPDAMPADLGETYEDACSRLGVDPRPEGWALWNTWGEGNVRVTMIVSAMDTTEGLLLNWARGRTVYPVMPVPSQIALIHQGWSGPMIFSPFGRSKLGLGGHS